MKTYDREAAADADRFLGATINRAVDADVANKIRELLIAMLCKAFHAGAQEAFDAMEPLVAEAMVKTLTKARGAMADVAVDAFVLGHEAGKE